MPHLFLVKAYQIKFNRQYKSDIFLLEGGQNWAMQELPLKYQKLFYTLVSY